MEMKGCFWARTLSPIEMFQLSLQVSQHLRHLRTPFLKLNSSYSLNSIVSAQMQLVLVPIVSSLEVDYFLDQSKTASYLAVTSRKCLEC